MNPFRLLGPALLLLVVFLAAALASQWWLRRETRRLTEETIETQRRTFARLIDLTRRPVDRWDETYLKDLGALVGGRVELRRRDGAVPADTAALSFDQDLPDAPGWRARVSFSRPALSTLLALHQRTLVATALLAVLVSGVPLLLLVLGPRREPGASGLTQTPWKTARADAAGLEHFAKVSVERGAALERETGARRRAEEDLQLSQAMLDRSHEERARLGRDLHDNICQTLYAVSLTLESVRKKMTAAPETERRLDHCTAELRRLNQEVRAYIREIGTEGTPQQTFAEAFEQMLRTLPAGDGVSIAPQLDPGAVALIQPQQAADIVNILREAISNGLRHGGARHITLRAEHGGDRIALAVQDDGTGFVGAGPSLSGGHGLVNMRARAEALGGTLRVDSTPGKGTRVLLTVPVVSAA